MRTLLLAFCLLPVVLPAEPIITSTTSFGASVRTQYAASPTGFSFESFINTADSLALSSGQLTFADSYISEGPVRSGFLQGVFAYDATRYGGTYSAYTTIAGTTYNSFGPSRLIPITLGTTIPVNVFASATSVSDDGTPSYVVLQTVLQINFLEADGTTSVTISEAPEPTSAALLSLGITALPLLILCRRILQGKGNRR
jgi:hypothetical protein